MWIRIPRSFPALLFRIQFMLSYRHAFHAGNYADVLKHFIVCRILDYLIRKPGAIHYIDTHAGAGTYDLRSETAQRLGEHKDGIALLMNLSRNTLPESVRHYLELVRLHNGAMDTLNMYPGSPWFAASVLRKQDRLSLCELQSAEFASLLKLFPKNRKLRCYGEDGFSKVRALIPPKTERRAMVLVDPSYEVKEDYKKVPALIKELHHKFAVGIYVIWYPIVSEFSNKLVNAFKNSGIPDIQRFELSRSSDPAKSGMNSTGILVINPPWNLKTEVEELFSVFAPLLSDIGDAHTLSEELVKPGSQP